VGFVTAGIFSLLPAAIRIYRQQFAEARIQLTEASTNELLELLEQDKLDLALIHPRRRHPASVMIEDLQRDRPVAALPQSHPLARRRQVTLHDLASEPLIFFPRSASPDLYKRFIDAFARQGLKPRIDQEARLTPTILAFVSAELGYALVPESVRALPFSNVVFRAIEDLPADLVWSLALAWKPGTASPLARAFGLTLRSIAGPSPAMKAPRRHEPR